MLVGVALVVLGLVGVTLAGPPLTLGDRTGIATALATGVAIAGYTVVDGSAVSGGAPVLAYAGWLFLLQSWVVPIVAVARRGRRLPALARKQALPGSAGAWSRWRRTDSCCSPRPAARSPRSLRSAS